MTNDQFAALAELIRLRQGPAQECIRLVLVDGLTQTEACALAGLSRQAGHQAVKRALRGLELARRCAEAARVV